jgi:two-component system aerobic respiration control sensor histidine kinase ArcB
MENINRNIILNSSVDQKHFEEVSEAHYFIEDILYNLPGLIYWKNKNYQYVGFNKNVMRLSGLTCEQLYGKTDLELNWGKKEAESFQKDDQEVMDMGITKITEHQIPISYSDRAYAIVRTEKSCLYDKNGNVAGVLGVAMDVTEQKILEEKLIAEKERAEQLNQAKTEFIRNMEHDIRTPFSGIYSLAEILQTQEKNPEKKQLINAITQCAKELLNYCNGILDFSRIESGVMPILFKKFNLHALVNSVVAMEKPVAIDKKLLLITEYSKDIPEIFVGDEYRIQRILINLMSNAVKFTNKGHVKISIKLAKKINNKEFILRFFIEDTGIGIPKEKQACIYERFNRLTPANEGKYKGSGLGLSVVKYLVEELSGEIEVNSRPKKGTVFVCTLPLKSPLIDDVLFEDKGNHG